MGRNRTQNAKWKASGGCRNAAQWQAALNASTPTSGSEPEGSWRLATNTQRLAPGAWKLAALNLLQAVAQIQTLIAGRDAEDL
jgi:hypothetical protein